MDDQYLCTCTLCGPEGTFQSRSTAQRHRFDDKLRSIGPEVPPVHGSPPRTQRRRTAPVFTATTEADDPHETNVPNSPLLNPPLPSSSEAVERVMHHVHVRNAAWRFPPSLVFATPPTEDSSNFTPRTIAGLRFPNSTFPLSLRDQESAQVVGYECFLNETLQVLESYIVHEDDPLATQIAESINTILDILIALETHKGAGWDRQVRAKKSPDTYVLTGSCIPLYPYSHLISSPRSVFYTSQKGTCPSRLRLHCPRPRAQIHLQSIATEN